MRFRRSATVETRRRTALAEKTAGLELWGGAECTLNRLADSYCDQSVLSGHDGRLADLDAFAALGLKALRLPVLWERVAPDSPTEANWSWADESVRHVQALGVRPILGLVHHGGGPRHTSLLSDSFAPGLAGFARQVAERYPWVTDWTPVNEPLTTARFSALYGLWHPHADDEPSFWLALLNEIDAVRLAMAEIRKVNRDARLIQTEDLGRTYGTAATEDQAAFDNQRRWMTWDLLCGAVTPGHPLWSRLKGFGFEDRLAAIADDPCPPDILGVNHYLTSDRLLDERVDRYPAHTRGGNGRLDYADVEAVRVLTPGPEGVAGALQSAWERYGRPLAVTESHNGCTREEQMRWVWEAWDAAGALRRRGVDVRAVTAWSLLGAFHWDCLLTHLNGGYEPGAFDVRGPRPRPTRLAKMLADLATHGDSADPLARTPGWWRRDIRLQYQPVLQNRLDRAPRPRFATTPVATRPILIVGATGTLGQAFARACEWRGLDYVLTSRADLDLDDLASIRAALGRFEPWAAINAAGYVRVDEAETDANACFACNATGATRLAEVCAERSLPCVGFSSDLVFDGEAGRPYVESDAPSPLSVYGASKAAGERGVLAANERALMIRTSAFFSPFDRYNLAHHLVAALTAGAPFAASAEHIVSPTYVPDLVDNALDLLIDGEAGLWHLASGGVVSWADFGAQIAEALGLDAELIVDARADELGWVAARPRSSPLVSERGWVMPSLEGAIERYAAALTADGWPEPLAQAQRKGSKVTA
jgi:dTDP-4-dehydrorhamnose reductase